MARVLSAAVLVALVVFTIWWLPWWGTVALATLAAGMAGGELARLAAAGTGAVVPSGIAALASAVACLAFVIGQPEAPVYREHALGALLLATTLAAGLTALAEGVPSPAALTRAGMLGLAPLYVGLPLGAAAWVAVAHGPAAISWLVALMAVSDSAQYYAGRAFGRRKLAPTISPGKTVAGAVGGFGAAVVVGAALTPAALGLPWTTGLALSAVLAPAGMCGDLFESLLKRSAGVKDSSAIIPGHGGVLDRIDSYLFAAPAFYLYLRLIG